MAFLNKSVEHLPALTEALVQDVVYGWCRNAKHEITVPNCGSIWGPEADVASVTKSRLGHEFEIKVSRADWLAELRQIRGDKKCTKLYRARTLADAKERAEKTAAMAADGKNTCGLVPPSYFWMVTVPGIIQEGELPEYAGLLEVVPHRFGAVLAHGYMLKQVTAAPRLHRIKLLDSQVMALARGVSLRYWQQRRAG